MVATPSLAPVERVNLRWLVRMRWVAYLGLLLLVGSVQQLVRVQFHQPLALTLVLLGLTTNLLAMQRLAQAHPARASQLLLIADFALTTVLLLVTGGPGTPLVLAYVALLVVASVVLPRKTLWLLSGLVALALLVTALVHAPVSVDHDHGVGEHNHHADQVVATEGQHFWLHVRDLWVATLALVLLVVYVVRWGFSQRESELQALRDEIERHARLAELWTLAASAAHELGTPLATISVISNELKRRAHQAEWGACISEDVAVICEQLERCKTVLQNMTNEARSSGREPGVELTLEEFVEQARQSSPEADRIDVRVPQEAALSRGQLPRRLVLSVVQTLLDNALEAAPAGSRVLFEAASDEQRWSLQITDGGPGLSQADLDRAGRQPFTKKHQGMGVGLFLGQTIVDRLGGELKLSSGAWGTTAHLTLPRVLSTGPIPPASPTHETPAHQLGSNL